MSFCRPRFTNAGRALQLRSIGGTQINFTKIKVGDGEITGSMDYKTFTDLISTKATLPLTGIKIEDGYAKITGYFNNSELTEAFNYRELGLFATDPDDPTNEILYCYANYGEDYVYIAQPSSEIIERTVSVVAIVDDAVNVTATLDSSAVYVDDEDLADAIALHNADPNAHPGLPSQLRRSVTCYLNPDTTESSSSRDGTADHPFKYVKEATTAYPNTQYLSLTILLTSTEEEPGKVMVDAAGGLSYWIGAYDSIRIINESNSASKKFVLADNFNFSNTRSVYIRGMVDFTIDEETDTLKSSTGFYLQHCDKVILDLWAGTRPDSGYEYVTEGSYLVKVENCDYVRISTPIINGVTTSDDYDFKLAAGYLAVDPPNGKILLRATKSSVYFYSNFADDVYCASQLVDSVLYMFGENGAEVPYYSALENGLYLDMDTMNVLSDGSFKTHFTLSNNPHHVSLAQAAAQGGILGVANGGTGKNTLGNGAILVGNGGSAVTNLLGSGALYAASNGNPLFGTLPIAQGGTGRTTDGVNMASDQTADHGVLGSITFPGGICLLWGRLKFDGTNTASISFGSGRTFANASYSITFTEWEVTLDNITKTTTGFTAQKFLTTTKILDFMVVGKLA